MKTSEVFKELEINPNKIFEMSIRNGYFRYELKRKGQYFNITCYNKDGSLVEEHMAAGRFNGNINIDADWQEVKQPVTWQKAIQAWLDGKRIYLEDTFGFSNMINKDMLILEGNGNKLIATDFKEGKWYIE